jgi:hypothetical protein
MNDLLFTQGQDNLAGLADLIYLTASVNIKTLPDLAVANSLKTAAADIVCVTGTKFTRVYYTDETGKVETKSIGERDGKGRQTTLTAHYPALGVESADFISDVQNTPVVILYRLARNGKFYMMGVNRLDKSSVKLSGSLPAYFDNGDASSGEKHSDQNGVTLGWIWSGSHDPIEYAGTIASLLVPAE